MKRKIKIGLLIFCVFAVQNFVIAQSNDDIARVYFGRAQQSLQLKNAKKARGYFEKAEALLGGVFSKTEDANLGAMIFYTLEDYKKCQTYVEKFFSLNPPKENAEYGAMLEMFVNCDEKIKAQEEEEKRKAQERVRIQIEKRRIDSLTAIWNSELKGFDLEADTIFSFNKKGIALYKNKGYYGIIDDRRKVLEPTSKYEVGYSYGSYIVLADKREHPTKITVYDCEEGEQIELPDISSISPIATSYGTVLFVRENGVLILYPETSTEILSYDIKKQNITVFGGDARDAIFKELKKNKIINSFKSDGRVRINGDWYQSAGYLGGGVVPLLEQEGSSVAFFFFASSGKMLPVSEVNYIGAFYEGVLQGNKGNEIVWLNRSGELISPPKDQYAKYSGNSKVERIGDGRYAIFDKVDKVYLKREKKLPELKIYLKNHKKKE